MREGETKGCQGGDNVQGQWGCKYYNPPRSSYWELHSSDTKQLSFSGQDPEDIISERESIKRLVGYNNDTVNGNIKTVKDDQLS